MGPLPGDRARQLQETGGVVHGGVHLDDVVRETLVEEVQEIPDERRLRRKVDPVEKMDAVARVDKEGLGETPLSQVRFDGACPLKGVFFLLVCRAARDGVAARKLDAGADRVDVDEQDAPTHDVVVARGLTTAKRQERVGSVERQRIGKPINAVSAALGQRVGVATELLVVVVGATGPTAIEAPPQLDDAVGREEVDGLTDGLPAGREAG
jgi:hypothetical protein